MIFLSSHEDGYAFFADAFRILFTNLATTLSSGCKQMI